MNLDSSIIKHEFFLTFCIVHIFIYLLGFEYHRFLLNYLKLEIFKLSLDNSKRNNSKINIFNNKASRFT